MIEFLNPFVWALSFSLIPVIIYLYRFYSRKKYIFPTVKFVYSNEKTRWLNINIELVKLFLRILIIVTIVLIFSSPVVSKKKENGIVFFLDNSYSSRFNFDKYLYYIRNVLKEHPSEMDVKIIDNSGSLISGTSKEVINKLKYYYPEVRGYSKEVVNILRNLAKGYRVVVLTDGQKSFWEFLKDFGAEEYEIITFPSFSIDAKADLRIWNRLAKNIEGEVEVYSKSNSNFKIVLTNLYSEKIILSSEVIGKKNFFVKFSNPFEGISILNVLIFRDRATNEFFVPLTSLDKVYLNVPNEYKKFFSASLSSLGLNFDYGNESVNISVLDNGSISSMRNSIIIPKSPKSRFLYEGTFITFSTNLKMDFGKFTFYSFHSLPLKDRISPTVVPESATVLRSGSLPIGVYFERENNLLILGTVNLYDSSLPIFLKESLEFLLIDSKFLTNSNWYNYDGTLAPIPSEEISDAEVNLGRTSQDRNNINMISFLLFALLCVFMVVERYT